MEEGDEREGLCPEQKSWLRPANSGFEWIVKRKDVAVSRGHCSQPHEIAGTHYRILV